MRRREDGAAALEFALLAPVLFMLLFGIIAFGFLLAQDLALGNSARQAARYGVVNNSNGTCAGVVTEAQNSAMPLVVLPAPGVTVRRGSSSATATDVCGTSTNKPCTGSQPTDNIYVTLSFDANVVVPMPGIGSTKHLTGEGVFRCEFS
jgi:Flp pilus assembly protein TadG